MLQDREIAINQFIKITSGGIRIADYDQVQAALVKKYKEIYGSDIDLSNTTADGTFVNNLALIINNILQSFKVLYANLDVNTASGVYLDSLCRLSNITRKTATKSTAQLRITATQQTQIVDGTLFVDSTGNQWEYNGNTITVQPNTTAIEITVSCTEYGPVEAPIGSISETLEASYLTVTQAVAASVGQNDESDSSLRARRAQSTGASGTTVLESIVGSLLDVDGIDDVRIINNNTDDNETAEDGNDIDAHSIYVIIRKAASVTIEDSVIGSIIYDKLTPGISTNAFTGSNGTAGSYTKQLDAQISWLSNTVYWKNATYIHPTFTVTITPGTFFSTATIPTIKQKVIDYMNEIKLGKLPVKNSIIIAATYTNSSFNGEATYIVKDVELTNITSNPETFFKYDIANATHATSGDDIIITFA